MRIKLLCAFLLCFFSSGSLGDTQHGKRAIESLKVGDLVWAKDESTGEIALKPIVQTFERVAPSTLVLTFSNGETIETTVEHPFYVQDRGFTPAGLVALGNSIVTRAGPSLQVTRIEKHSSPQRVYNFEVEDYHTYFVGEGALWTHNTVCDIFNGARAKADSLRSLPNSKRPEMACAMELNDGQILVGASKFKNETLEEFQARVDPDGRVRLLYNRVTGEPNKGRGVGHGSCAEYSIIAQIVRNGYVPTGAKSVSVLIRGTSSNKHGFPVPACDSCAQVMARLHIEDMHKVAAKLTE